MAKIQDQINELQVGGGQTGASKSATPTGTVAKAPGNSKSNGMPMEKGQNPGGTGIEDTSSENNTKPTGDTSAANKASVAMKPSAASASQKEAVQAMFNGEDLSEEFKEKVTVVFEAAVAARVNEQRAELEAEFETKLEEALTASVEDLTEKLDGYLDYAVEQWMTENAVAIEQHLRSEITEDFITGLRNLFIVHNIDLPDEKVDVVEQLAAEVQDLQSQLDQVVNEKIELSKTVVGFNKQQVFGEVAEGLADTQAEKLMSLAEGVEFEDVESYKKKLEVVRETYFPSDKKTAKPKVLNEEEEPVDDVDPVAVTGPMSRYVKAISQTATPK